MVDILALRAAMRTASANLHAEEKQLESLISVFKELPQQLKPPFQLRIVAQQKVVATARAAFNASAAVYNGAVATDPMHAADPGLPLLLLPVRIETAYFPNAAGTQDLVVRIYPDDVHVDSHEPELTAEELAAGTEYWRAVWGAGMNPQRLDAAWAGILSQLKPARASWAVRALTPTVPRPLEVPPDQAQPEPPLANAGSRPGTFNRPAHTTLLPDFWRVIGLRADGSELFYAEGLPIPKTLDLSFAPPGMVAPGAPDDLPFHPEGRWLVDLDAAIAAGMALRIPLTGPDFSVAQLFVLGVDAAVAPDEAALRLESALRAHQYTNGLAFLPPGSPTNNTANTRSAWQSAPEVPVPAAAAAAREAYVQGSRQNAAVAASAFGIDGSSDLAICSNALLDEESDISTIQQFLWPAIAGKSLSWLYTKWDFPLGSVQQSWITKIDFPFVSALQNHVGHWVRSRGTLPTIRVGNQPYGLLPALSLDGWVVPVGDPLTSLITLLRTLRSYWLASVLNTPHVPAGPDPNADSTVVGILQRLPVSNDIQVRQEADPMVQAIATLPPAPIPAMATNSQYFLASPAATTTPLPIRVVNDPAADLKVLRNFQALYHDGVAVMEQQPGNTRDTFTAKYKDLIGAQTFPDPPPADLFLSLVQDSYTDPLIQDTVNNLNSLAGFIICAALFFDPANVEFIQGVNKNLPAARDFVARFDALCNTNPAGWEGAIHEILDVFSHRLDAWITSLAARRLDEMRAAKPAGVVLGAYGFVENLSPRGAVSDQVYIHAPSMSHATTAAVLRAGYDSHQNSGPLAVNLTSNRVRNADWLASGIRSGQTLGALLGYRFERGLHDVRLDRLIAPLRKNFALPQVTPPNAGAADQVTGPVVDGLALVRKKDTVANTPGLALQPAEKIALNSLLGDLADVLDSFGDLLMAESVHHLVGGNPLRAGLTADSAGRGEPLPGSFDVTRTPRSARPLMWELGALLPADFRSGATGWKTDRVRAKTEPHLEAWVAGMLGNAGAWQIACTLTTAAGPVARVITIADLALCALDVVAESSGAPSQLELRIEEFVSGGLPDGSSVSVSTGFGELISLAGRVRSVLAKSSALRPEHLQGPGSSTTAGVDLNELDARVGLISDSLKAATAALRSTAQALDGVADDAAVQAMRAALITVSDHGIPAAWPSAGTSSAEAAVSALRAQAASLLAALSPLAGQDRPAVPGAGADSQAVAVWIRDTIEYVQGIAGSSIPLLPVYSLPANSVYASAFAKQPEGGDGAAAMTWLRRVSRIRDNGAAMHDVLLASEALQGTPVGFTLAQFPGPAGARWAGLPFPGGKPPEARVSLVFSTPAPIDPAVPFCGFLCDNWTEQLPGVTSVATGDRKYEASEVTGMAFKADTPAATAPQAMLLAVAPDPAAGWSLDVLFDTVKETLDLAKMRPVDLGDLIRFGRVLPAIHSSSNVDQALADAAKQKLAHQ